MSSSTILVTGASGYIGGRLVPELLNRGHSVRCLARTPNKLRGLPWSDRVEVTKGDLSDPSTLPAAFAGVDVAYYLVHSMEEGATKGFSESDRRIARTFRRAATDAGVSRIIYLGGLGDDEDPELSTHLKSRHEVGEILADGPVPVTELRAAVIIGSGSASFEMLRNLVEVLPAMITPRWVGTRCQPIAIRDVLFYLAAVLDNAATVGQVLEVGGPDVLAYQEMMNTYANLAGLKKRWIVPVPLLTPSLSSHWIGLVTPLPTPLAKPLVHGLANEVVVRDHRIEDMVPRQRLPYVDAINLAIARTRDLEVTTNWAGADLSNRSAADPMATDPEWSGGTVEQNVQVMTTGQASASSVYKVVCGIGGRRGWFITDYLWEIRGTIDAAIGGVGMRRGRRHPDNLRVGDALDFWRVESLEEDRHVRLRAEMKVPGTAWLEWTISHKDGVTKVKQWARFHPKGLPGRLYWWSLLPFHAIIFKGLLQSILQRAEYLDRTGNMPDAKGRRQPWVTSALVAVDGTHNGFQ